MAERGSDEIVEKAVCGICLEGLKQPKLLPCFHSFCLNCLDNYVTKYIWHNTLRAPFVSSTELPEDGARQFQINYNMYFESEQWSNETHTCDLCGPDVNADTHCTDCEKSY